MRQMEVQLHGFYLPNKVIDTGANEVPICDVMVNFLKAYIRPSSNELSVLLQDFTCSLPLVSRVSLLHIKT